MPQQSSLQFELTVRQVVDLGRAPYGDRAARREALVEEALADCDLGALAERSYLNLSGGEKQRVHLARVLTQLRPDKPDAPLQGQVLLLDEPTSAMDIPHQESCLALLRRLRDQGCAIALVMHDINRLLRECDRLLLLKGGAIHAVGETKSLLNAEALSALFDYPLAVSPVNGGALSYVHPGVGS